MDTLVRAITSDGMVQAVAVSTRELTERARQIHTTLPVATAALGRVLAAASMMGNALKDRAGSVTLQIKGGGPLGTVLAVSDHLGNVRGYVQQPHVDLPLRPDGKLDVGAAVGHEGTLTVIKDLGMKEPYVGSVALLGGEIAEDLAAYFVESEQIPTACALGVLVDRDQSVKAAGGYLIQLLPGAGEDVITKVEGGVLAAGAATGLLERCGSPAEMLRTVLSDFEVEILETDPIEYRCYCSRERVERALISLGREELESMLREQGVINSDAIDRTDEVYQAWTSESLSLKDYLTHAIEQDWVDITLFAQDQKYVDTDELYSALVTYILEQLQTDSGFEKLVYQYLILQDQITGNQLCLVLYEQGILPWDESAYQSLRSGGMSAFNFLREKIRTLEITPAQLGLEPSSGSCVMIDTNTGELLACVTYPGYDTNRLANTMDSDYYSYLNQNLSNPLYNHATQQRTAPGSTFKMVTATAGLAAGVITTTSTIQDRGIYENVSNHPRCWAYPRTHGVINVSQAIRDSCNYFFYEVGFRLAGSGNYSDAAGIEKIQKYAAMYGLTEKTGIELVENTSQIATEYPVMAAIGQSDNNLTTIGLARYVTAVANSGTVYNLSLLNKVTDKDGNVLETFGSSVKNQIDVLDASEWNAIHSGMRMVVENSSAFRNFSVNVAGKTGTAEIGGHPNHALFVGYAPYENPQIALATRITYGYTSSNAAALSRDILDYYFNGSGNILNGQASEVAGGNDVSD